MSKEGTLRTRDVRRRFDRAAKSFNSADFVHAVTRKELLARLEPLIVDARRVLDLGSAAGAATQPLRKRFGRAHVVSLDLSHEMLRQGRKKKRLFARASGVQANALQLPFGEQCFDVIFANLLLPWIDDPRLLLQEVSRVLRKDGVFAFATLGPDSLLELSRAWSTVDTAAHVNYFPDMHDIGDALVNAGLRDPVLDVDRLQVSYSDHRKLFSDLTQMGARNSLRGRNRSLVGRRRFAHMVTALANGQGGGEIHFDLELVYGHCWGGGGRNIGSDYHVDATRIGHRKAVR